ncbi:MAG: M23 family metallopeptidase [Bacteroidales bacterium]|nr:M23 family metallopeptidase [Bacteroidales bacterium]
MPIRSVLSASFAELRENHFHSGIDIRTDGVCGVNVFAVEDGYVSRIKISPFGYGKAIYIDHPDGHTTVYAHLNEFAAPLNSITRAEQYRKKSFSVDFFPKAGSVKVKRGQLIAFSGNTGSSGGPHLHFEVRDTKSEEPLNPLAYIPKIADTTAPTIYGIKCYAQNDDAYVDNRLAEKYYTATEVAQQTIVAFGEIGIGLHATDFFDEGGRPCGVVDVKLFDNDVLKFHSHIDRFNFDDTRYINSFIDFAEHRQTKRYVQKSFVEANNRLKIYRKRDAIFIGDGERHAMRYELTDYAGNKKTLSFNIIGKKFNNARRAKPQGELVDWQKTWTKDANGASVIIPHEAMYRDNYIYVTTSYSDIYKQNIYTIGSPDIPLQKKMTITLPIPEAMRNGRNLFIGIVDDKNVMKYVGGTRDGNTLTVKTFDMGRFAVGTDTIAPKVVTQNTRNVLNSHHYLMVGLTDEMSGIDTYNCYVDGRWVLLDYDYKTAKLKAQISTLGIAKGAHTLKTVVSDACGNTSTLEWNFTLQ